MFPIKYYIISRLKIETFIISLVVSNALVYDQDITTCAIIKNFYYV